MKIVRMIKNDKVCGDSINGDSWFNSYLQAMKRKINIEKYCVNANHEPRYDCKSTKCNSNRSNTHYLIIYKQTNKQTFK